MSFFSASTASHSGEIEGALLGLTQMKSPCGTPFLYFFGTMMSYFSMLTSYGGGVSIACMRILICALSETCGDTVKVMGERTPGLMLP